MPQRKRRGGSKGGFGGQVVTIIVVLMVTFGLWKMIPGEGDTLYHTAQAKNQSLSKWYQSGQWKKFNFKLPHVKIDGVNNGKSPHKGNNGSSGGSGDSGSSGSSSGSSGGSQKPTMSKSSALKTLESIKTAEPQRVAYNRDQWKHWVDVRSCWTTREQVLYEEADKGTAVLLDKNKHKTSNVNNACYITGGKWHEPYAGKTVDNPRKLDIDHMIPLSYVAKQGGQAWSSEKKQKYANDLSYSDHLVASDSSANRIKGDQGPSTWKPSNKSYHCAYATAWVTVAKNYSIPLPSADKAALKSMLGTCK